MTDIKPLLPRQPVPPLSVLLAGGGRFDLAAEKPQHFSMIVFYRGLHCPQCRNYLKDLESKLAEFDKRGVSVVAISSDVAERGESTKQDWGLPNMRLGYGLGLAAARAVEVDQGVQGQLGLIREDQRAIGLAEDGQVAHERGRRGRLHVLLHP